MTASPQMDLLEFGAQEALRRREAGMARVLGHDAAYRERLLNAIEVLAAKGTPFTADHARALCGDPPADVHFNLTGAVFNAAAKAGLIRFAGYATSTRAQGHGNRIVSWKGVS